MRMQQGRGGPKTRNPATGQGDRAIAKANFNTDDDTTKLLDRQARRLARLYRCSLPFAIEVARLAYTVAR
jgi:hypothetical protein